MKASQRMWYLHGDRNDDRDQLCKDQRGAGTPLVIQWLRLRAPNAGGPGSISGQGTRSHVLQLRARMLQLKILHAATKDPTHHNEDPACCN